MKRCPGVFGKTCLTDIPVDRGLCRFCQRTVARMDTLAHISSHLAPSDRTYLDALLKPNTITAICRQLSIPRTTFEYHWFRICDRLGLERAHGGHSMARLALSRMALGVDPCFCTRAAA